MSQIKESYFNWSSRHKTIAQCFFTFFKLKMNNLIFGADIFEIIEGQKMKSCVWKKKSSFFQNNLPLFSIAFLSQITIFKVCCGKVHIFWEGHKFLRNFHRRFVLCSNSQICGEILQNFVAFSEYLNFN